MVVVTVLPENNTIEFKGLRTVRGLLNKLGLNEVQALIIRDGRLLTADRNLKHGDRIEVRKVVSAG